MRIADFPLAATLVAEHGRIAQLLERAGAGKFGVVVSGTYQPVEIVEAARGAVTGAFAAQLAELEASLAAVGVTCEARP